ncbi:MAG: glycosyltransferase [Anaerolineae bacterium]|nr:glycosyltransferase [Anaerolineae bacterium]
MQLVDWLVTELCVAGGAETFVRRVTPRLRQSGWNVRVVTLVGGGSLAHDLRADNVPVIELAASKRDLSCALVRLYRLWRREPPALIHTHLYHAGIVGRIMARFMHLAPVIVHQHGPESYRSRLRTVVDRMIASWGACYVTSCQAVAEVLHRRERIPPARIYTIYNGLDLKPDMSVARPTDWPVPPGALTIGCVGRFSSEKGQLDLLEALACLCPDAPLPHCIFLGDGQMRPYLKQRRSTLNLIERVHFMGVRNDVKSWLSCFDLFVLPSLWEGISLALLEAMAAGLPVVATAVGGTPEVVVDGVTGLLVPPADPDALAQAISTLLRNPDLRRSLGQAGQRRVLEHFSMTSTVRRIIALYEALLCEKGID